MKWTLVAGTAFAAVVLASPTRTTQPLDPRKPLDLGSVVSSTVPSLQTITNDAEIDADWEEVVSGLTTDASELAQAGDAFVNLLEALAPYGQPTDVPAALASVASVYAAHPTSFFVDALTLVEDSLTAPPSVLIDAALGPYSTSTDNRNLRLAGKSVYPADPRDAPYSIPENQLRSAIYIPSTFTYGQKPPVVLFPGTGNFGGQTYAGNLLKLFADVDYADPVWVNVPGALLDDIQNNVQYMAYAINYISSISDFKQVAVVTWSQGSMNLRWANKYWPSTIDTTSTHVAFSPDYHGTVLAYGLCPGYPKLPCDPSILQQAANSNFVSTLLSSNGDSAYVPTTDIYSSFDEIVEPQANEQASGRSSDVRGVGVTDIQIQNVCYGQVAGGPYPHEGTLYNALGVAAAIDALTHKSNAQLDRFDVTGACMKPIADGLTLQDLLLTESVIPIAAVNLLAYPNKLFVEPGIRSYAANN